MPCLTIPKGKQYAILSQGVLAFASLVALGLAAPAHAENGPIIFNFTGTVSGSDNGVIFTDQNITFFAFGNTGSSSSVSPGVYVLPVSPVTFALTGVGSGTITDAVQVFDDQNLFDMHNSPVAGLTIENSEDFFDVGSSSFATYDLTTSLGPIATTPYSFGGLFNSSLGKISLSSLTNPTFTAFAPAAVPESSTTVSFGLLLALGVGGLVIAKKKKAAAA